jgi:bifunctional enzyme CysN/CysC
MDLVGYSQEVFDAIQRDYTGFVAKLGIPDVQFIPLSALKGDNVVEKSAAMPWYEGAPLLGIWKPSISPPTATWPTCASPCSMSCAPTSISAAWPALWPAGILRKGDEVMILPSGKPQPVTSIVTYDRELDEAFAPMAVAVTLADQIDISRGDMLVHPDIRRRFQPD